MKFYAVAVSTPLLVSLVCLGCGPATDDANRIVVTGSSTIAPLLTEIAQQFEAEHPDVRIDVQTGGTGKGIADVRQGTADIGMASRLLSEDEVDVQAHQIAGDGVCMILHASNPLEKIENEDIAKIYRGEIKNWKELGGADLPITVVHKAEGRATLEVFLKHFQLENPQIKPDVIVGHNEQGIKTVASNEGAIGYVSIGTAEADVKAGVTIKLLPLDGIEATSANVADGSFPMSRPLNLVTYGEVPPLTQEFIDFARSKTVHEIIVKQYFVPINR